MLEQSAGEALRDIDLLGWAARARRDRATGAPCVRLPRPLSPKKSEKNSWKRLLPPNGDRPVPRL
jgi:hypothetical protein